MSSGIILRSLQREPPADTTGRDRQAAAAVIVERAGISSIQDFGRAGLQRFGIASVGALDPEILALGNALVANRAETPAIEVGPAPMRWRTTEGPLRFALAGADRPLTIDGRPSPPWQSIRLEPGSEVSLGPARDGLWSYICLQGGMLAEPQHGSFSADARANLGAPFTRPLRDGDTLPVTAATRWDKELRCVPPERLAGRIRVVLGPQDDYFRPETVRRFLATTWRTSLECNRMCYRLEGPVLAHARGYNIISDATVDGAIQIAGNGQPFVLMADRGTVGGYPKIAVIASVDLPRFAQLPLGAPVGFAAVSADEARNLLRDRVRTLARHRPQHVGEGRFAVDLTKLSQANVAGSAVSALDPAPSG